MAFVDIPARLVTTSSMYIDVNQLMDNINALLDGTQAFTDLNVTNDLSVTNDLNVGGKITVVDDPAAADEVGDRAYNDARYRSADYNTNIVVADYAILDADGYDIIEVDSRTGDKTITLPTIADNIGRPIYIKVPYAGGLVTVDGEGGENIDGEASVYLLGKDDYVILYGGAAEWKKTGILSTYDTGWINRSDYRVCHMGTMNVTYDTLVGAFTVGELVTFASGVTGIVQADSGAVLKLKNMTGVGFGANNESITGATSGATALVDEAGTGSSKDLDSDLFHQMGKNLSDLMVQLQISTDGSDANSFAAIYGSFDINVATAYIAGITKYQVDTNYITLQTGTNSAMIYQAGDGTLLALQAQDYYYKIKVMRII